jgi:hypothetical protein
VLRKKPPKRRNGITTGGPMDSAMFTLLLMEEIKYPENKKTFIDDCRSFNVF